MFDGVWCWHGILRRWDTLKLDLRDLRLDLRPGLAGRSLAKTRLDQT